MSIFASRSPRSSCLSSSPLPDNNGHGDRRRVQVRQRRVHQAAERVAQVSDGPQRTPRALHGVLREVPRVHQDPPGAAGRREATGVRAHASWRQEMSW